VPKVSVNSSLKIALTGYNLFRKDRSVDREGGIVIL